MISVNGQPLEWVEGMTVSDVLDAMGYTALSLITVFVDGDHVPADDYGSVHVRDGAEVKALHLHHGG